jgi:hypothetical protein
MPLAFIKYLAMIIYGGVIHPLIPDLGCRQKWVLNFTAEKVLVPTG